MTNNNCGILFSEIFSEIKRRPQNLQPYQDAYYLCVAVKDESPKAVKKTINALCQAILDVMPSIPPKHTQEFFELYKKVLLLGAHDDFDKYMLYLEINRPPSERFYQPRRHILKKVVDEMQKLADDELDELFLSFPPRVGKTSLLMFFMTWIIGRTSEVSNLYSAYSDTITKAFYNGVLEVLRDPNTYLWHDVFPSAEIAATNAQEETLDIDRKKRYPSLTCRSLYGTLNGACDCSGFLISDDLIGGIEEALNPDRLIASWTKVDNNLIPRAKMSAKLLWVGTRWSVIDPAGIRMDLVMNDPRFKNKRIKVINTPALNSNEESNFDYLYNVGFSSDYFLERRASFERRDDMASWNAQYMGEPVEREGTLFEPSYMRYYNGFLPDDSECDRSFMAIDPAFGGGDYVAAPVIKQYGDDLYMVDCVFDNSDKAITIPKVANLIAKYDVTTVQIEGNKAQTAYKDALQKELEDRKLNTTLLLKPAGTQVSKEQRIFEKAPDIREFMIFLEDGCRNKEYSLFMQNVFAFKVIGKNKHDDAPDSLAMVMDYVRGMFSRRAQVFKRTF